MCACACVFCFVRGSTVNNRFFCFFNETCEETLNRLYFDRPSVSPGAETSPSGNVTPLHHFQTLLYNRCVHKTRYLAPFYVSPFSAVFPTTSQPRSHRSTPPPPPPPSVALCLSLWNSGAENRYRRPRRKRSRGANRSRRGEH